MSAMVESRPSRGGLPNDGLAPIPDLASTAVGSVGVGTQRRNSPVISLAEMPPMTKDLRPEFRSLACYIAPNGSQKGRKRQCSDGIY